MLKSGLAPMASTEDLEEVVSLIPDRSQDEQESRIRNNSSIADSSASNTDGQDDRKDCFISALDMIKDLLKEERMYCIQDNIDEKVFEFLTNILKKLEVGIQNSSTAMDQDLSTEENVTHLKELWDKMSPFDRMHARTVYFVVLSQLQRGTLTMWSYLRYILHLQRDADNCIWRLNHLDNYRKRVTKERKIRSHLRTLFLHLVKLNNFLLSSSIEQMVAQRPSLKYYGQGRSSNPVHLSRENSKVGFQTLNNVDMSFRDIARHETMWLHLALKEMLLDHQEWADIVSSRLSSRNGDDSADMDTESIGSILEEALKTTSCLLGLGTDPGKMYQDDGDGTCSMFRIEHLDEEKFRDTDDLEIIRNVNELVSLNHILFLLMWSLDKFTKLDYVWDREYGAEEDQDINDSYFAYKCRHIFNEEDLKLPNEICLTPMDDISFADDAIRVDAAAVGDAGFRLRKMGDRVLSLKNTKMAYIYDKMEDPCAFEQRLTNAYGPGARSWGRRLLMPIDALLFGRERDALREMAFSQQENPMQNMDRVALFIADDEGSLDVDTVPHHQDEVLQHAILSLRGSEMPREGFRARKIDVSV
ncbi:uncharacterized protein LOC124172763 [Ischnura elegans]|uniref:uncharacterized protein LOC124172763 n=1 Tax=Ischnura elegans TaxID=197161 RepID=UPI001ED89075|nr:uncharacterized protein LOC124172763 [Ischnura elegans]